MNMKQHGSSKKLNNHTMKITVEEQAEAENVSEETILSNKVNRLKEMGYKITKEGDYND